jgi:hypothetical protein
MTMTTELSTRNGLVSLLDAARGELLASYEGLNEERMHAPVEGEWTVKDILAHVAMWEETALADMYRAVRGDRPALASWDRSFLNEWNRIQLALRKQFPLPQVLHELADTRSATIEVVKSAPEERLTSGFIPATCAIHARHDGDHAAQIQEWRSKEGV